MCTDAVPKRSAQTAVVDRRCHDIVEHVQCADENWNKAPLYYHVQCVHGCGIPGYLSEIALANYTLFPGYILPRAPVVFLLPMLRKAASL